MTLTINGEDYYDLPVGMTVAQLLAHLELPEKKIAVECNREIVPKSTFKETSLNDGDRLEIIHFIGGG
ncbi:MAG: sulfur carrier protein ThiS [Maricaulaceae bacterium]